MKKTLAPKAVYRENVKLLLTDKDGNIKDTREYSNLVTNAGLAGLASLLNGAGGEAAFTYLAIGIGTTTEADEEDTTLESEVVSVGGERASATASRTSSTVANDTARLLHTWTFTGSLAITETGALNAASAGTLLNRSVFAAVSVETTDSLQVTIDYALANA